MKISILVNILLVVSILLFGILMMVNETEERYDVSINTSSWENTSTGTSRYDYASEVNESIYPIKSSIDDITNEDKGWLEKVGSGFTGIIAAVTFLPSMVWKTATLGGNIITGIGKSMGIPSFIIYVFLIMLLVWGIFKLVEFFQRWNV